VENTPVTGSVWDITPHVEEEWINHVLQLERHMFGTTVTYLRCLVFQIAEQIHFSRRCSKDKWRTQEFFRGGGFNKYSWGQRERGSGGGSPLVRGSGGKCNLVQEISYAAYTLYLYSYSQQGSIYSGFYSCSLGYVREFLLFLHWLPLNSVILLRMYFPQNWEFGSALSKLRNFGGV
jgi:hypothetical protein